MSYAETYAEHREDWEKSGWWRLIAPLIDECEANGIQVEQIKEKFGGLRFYADTNPDTSVGRLVQSHIDAAEEESFKVCQYCGAEGRLRGGSWLLTLCDACHVKRMDAKAAEQAAWEAKRAAIEAAKQTAKLEDEPANFRDESGKPFVVRCSACHRENWAPQVAGGTCAWCGWRAK